MIRWELNRKDLETLPKSFQICTTGWQEAHYDPHKLSNADSSIKESTTITVTAYRYLTNKFQHSVLLGTLNERCTYTWALSEQLLPWLVQVLFSRPLTFASAPNHHQVKVISAFTRAGAVASSLVDRTVLVQTCG